MFNGIAQPDTENGWEKERMLTSLVVEDARRIQYDVYASNPNASKNVDPTRQTSDWYLSSTCVFFLPTVTCFGIYSPVEDQRVIVDEK